MTASFWFKHRPFERLPAPSKKLNKVPNHISNPHMDYYSLLSVSRSASIEEIRRNYRALSLRLHPDKRANAAPSEDNEDAFKNVQKAWEVLREPERRAAYDASLGAFPLALGPPRLPQLAVLFAQYCWFEVFLLMSVIGIDRAASKAVHISDEIDLDSMEEEGREDNLLFWKPCRCGSRFEISEKELELGTDVIICEA